MVRRARKNRANLQNHYSILVQYVNDYFKWFVCWGIADVWTSGVVKNEFKAYTSGEECPIFAEPKPQRQTTRTVLANSRLPHPPPEPSWRTKVAPPAATSVTSRTCP